MITIMILLITATLALLTFLLMELDFKSGEWKKQKYKGKCLPL